MTPGRPEAHELIEAALEFLGTEALPAIGDPAVGFRLRIAMNALRMVDRELRLGPAVEARARQRLQEFLGSDDSGLQELNAALCNRIRAGACDAQPVVLLDLLEALTLDRLGIDNPNYDTYRLLRSPRGPA